MTIILLVAAAISAGVEIYNGLSHHFEFPTDVVIILAVVLINAILGVFQESKAEKAIEALQEMSKAQSKVIRDGKQISIPSEDLVVGDIIILEAGDAVPADARILECASMKIEEAALTGESVPVDKKEGILTAGENGDVALGDRKNMVFMGSTVVYGRGKAVVTATGMDTEMATVAWGNYNFNANNLDKIYALHVNPGVILSFVFAVAISCIPLKTKRIVYRENAISEDNLNKLRLI